MTTSPTTPISTTTTITATRLTQWLLHQLLLSLLQLPLPLLVSHNDYFTNYSYLHYNYHYRYSSHTTTTWPTTPISTTTTITATRLTQWLLDQLLLSPLQPPLPLLISHNDYFTNYSYLHYNYYNSTLDVTSHLQRIQNYAARVILRLPMSSRITIHLKSLHWLPVKVRSTYKIACLCYHCHSSTAPSYVTDMLHKKPLHTRNTRSSSYTMPLLNRPAHSKATLGDRSFSFASSSVWNSIPNDVKCAPSLSSFKSPLKTYLFHSVYKDWTASLITVHMCMVRPCHSFVDGLSKKCINVYFKKPN